MGATNTGRWFRCAVLAVAGVAVIAGASVVAPDIARASTLEPTQLSGTWLGEAAGRPFAMGLIFNVGGQVTGLIQVRMGPQVVAKNVAGTYALGTDATATIQLVEADAKKPTTYSGKITGREAAGDLVVAGKTQGKWSARLQ